MERNVGTSKQVKLTLGCSENTYNQNFNSSTFFRQIRYFQVFHCALKSSLKCVLEEICMYSCTSTMIKENVQC